MQMNVTMSTGDPLRYQWMFNGTTLPSQTNATLMIGDLPPMMAGEYNVVVSNPVGMVANLPAGVAMLLMQRAAGPGPSLTLYGPMNGHYRIDQTPSLGPTTAWATMTNLSISANPAQVLVGSGAGPMRFYRAVPTP